MSCSSVAVHVVGSRFKQLMGAFSFSDLISRLRDCAAALPDSRKGANTRFTMADIVCGCAAHRWFGLPIERPSRPHLERWMTELRDRRAAQEVLALPVV